MGSLKGLLLCFVGASASNKEDGVMLNCSVWDTYLSSKVKKQNYMSLEMKYGKEHKLKKHDSSAQIYVELKLQRRNWNSNLQHLKDLIPVVSYLLLMDFELHKDYMNIKYTEYS